MVNLYMKNKYANLAIMIRFIKRHNLLKQSIKTTTNLSQINKDICLYKSPEKLLQIYFV